MAAVTVHTQVIVDTEWQPLLDSVASVEVMKGLCKEHWVCASSLSPLVDFSSLLTGFPSALPSLPLPVHMAASEPPGMSHKVRKALPLLATAHSLIPSATTTLFSSITLLQPPGLSACSYDTQICSSPAWGVPSLQVFLKWYRKHLSRPFACPVYPFLALHLTIGLKFLAILYVLSWMAPYSNMNSRRVDALPFHLFPSPGSEHDAEVGTQCIFAEWILDDWFLVRSSLAA